MASRGQEGWILDGVLDPGHHGTSSELYGGSEYAGKNKITGTSLFHSGGK